MMASSRERSLNRYLWLLLAVMNLGDILASRRAFQLGIGELNPLVETINLEYGIFGVTLFKALWIFVLLLLLPFIRGWIQMLFAITCLIYFAVTLLHLLNLPPLL